MLISTNPATGETIWEGSPASQADIDRAFSSATHSDWPQVPLKERIAILEAFAKVVNREELALAISDEMGKPLWESETEVDAVIGKVAISIDAYRERCPTKTLGHVMVRHRPHGVCGVLGPFNFPGHLPNGHIVPALLAGNTVIFKPSEITPSVGQLMVGYWRKAGLPVGALNLLQGDHSVGKAIAEHPQLNALFFTGSHPAGMALSAYFGKHPEKLLALEMGGNSPLVVTQVNDLEAAATQTILSAFITSGQRCSCARRLIVVDNEPFVETLKTMIPRITVGPPRDHPFMGPTIHADKVRAQVGLTGEGPYIRPTLIERKLPDEEIFGPILQLIRAPNFEAAIEEANNTRYGLTAALFSNNRKEWEQFSEQVRAGVINWNQRTTGASSAAPFGGIGISGNHRPSAYYAADYCSYPVASIEEEALKAEKLP